MQEISSPSLSFDEIMDRLKKMGDSKTLDHLENENINVVNSFGINIPNLRELAKEIGINHELALKLWDYGNRESRILATLIDNIHDVTETQLNRWIEDLNSWELCDGLISNLFERHPMAYIKALEWSYSKKEYVKRAGFVLMLKYSIGNKNVTNQDFEEFWQRIIDESTDKRHHVMKAVSWAIRQIGKKNMFLHDRAIQVAETIGEIDNKTAQWISHDALKELRSEKIIERLESKEN